MQTNHSRFFLALAISLGLSHSALAANVPAGTALADKQEITINNSSEPGSIDPHKGEGVPESQIMYQLFEGLVSRDETGKIIAGIAERWENSPDFKQWTFHLRKNAKWSNGDPVTAHDFVYSWQRLVNPNTASPYASFLTYLQINNAQDIIDGKKQPNELGVTAVDDYTLVLSLSNPVPYAVGLTSHAALLPVPSKIVEKFGDAWVKPENIVSNGAYQLSKHIVNEKIEFVRNPLYWNDQQTVINKATFLEIASPTNDVSRYRSGEIDITGYGLPPELFPKLKKEIPNEVSVVKTLSTYVYEFNLQKKPFTDIRVRKALNLALDRRVITDKVLGQGQTPTHVFTPTYITEGEKIQQPAYATLPMSERNAKAIELLKQAGYSKSNPLRFNLLYNTNENHKKVAIAVAAMWKANTKGLVEVKMENQEWKTFIENRRAGKSQIARAGWSADYDQATTFGNYFLSNSSNNTAFYKNPAYDEAINSSYRAQNAEQRAEAYAKAEAILAEDAAVLPIYNYVNTRLVKPYVKGYTQQDPQDHLYLRNLYLIKH